MVQPGSTATSSVAAGDGAPISCSSGDIYRAHPGPAGFQATLGGVQAALTGTVVKHRWARELRRARLAVRTAGSSWQVDVPPHPNSGGHYFPGDVLLDGASHYLCLVRFAPQEAPVVVLATYAGGAHCCTIDRFYDVTTRQRIDFDAGNYPMRLQLADGHPVAVTADDAFSYVFASFADSCGPLRVYRPDGGRLREVSSGYPDLVAADAERAWRLAHERSREPLGFYACWAADQEQLGNDAKVWQVLDRLDAQGLLGRDHGGDWPGGHHYVVRLRQFLAERGYLAG